MARRRYQRGSLVKDGDRWIARWREDIALPSGEVKRIRRKEILGSAAELPTKKLAQRALDKRLEPINHEDYRPHQRRRGVSESEFQRIRHNPPEWRVF